MARHTHLTCDPQPSTCQLDMDSKPSKLEELAIFQQCHLFLHPSIHHFPPMGPLTLGMPLIFCTERSASISLGAAACMRCSRPLRNSPAFHASAHKLPGPGGVPWRLCESPYGGIQSNSIRKTMSLKSQKLGGAPCPHVSLKRINPSNP